MELNALPIYDTSDDPTGCCPRFNSQGWDDQDLHFKDKPFVKAKTGSIFHIPVNIGSVFKKTFKAIDDAHARDEKQFIVLSRDLSPWSAEHYFSVTGPVPDAELVRLDGDYHTQVFEGSFQNIPKWEKEEEALLGGRGRIAEAVYWFYTTCPKCAKVYGKNYVVAVAKLAS